MDNKRLDILKDLLVDEECTLEDLRRLVEKSKSFLKIESKSGKIIISPEFPFIVKEKIIIFLIGSYFSKELGLNNDIQITSRYMSEEIDIAQTTLSGPLGDLAKSKIIGIENNSYAIKFYEIEMQLNLLTEKYLFKKKIDTTFTSKKAKSVEKKKTNIKKQTSEYLSQKIIKTFQEESLKNEIVKHNLTLDDLYSVVNIVDNEIILLKGWKGSTNREGHVKAALLFLTINKLIYDLDEINSSELRKSLMNAGVEMRNFSSTLKNYSTYIIHKRGPIGSIKTSYRITSLGFQKGIMLLKDLIENTSNFDLKFRSRITKDISDKISINADELNQNIVSFAKDNGIDEEKLKILFEFQKEGIRICTPIKENTRKSLQIKTLMLLGVLLKKVYYVNKFSGKTLLRDSRTSPDRLDLLNSSKSYMKYFSANKPKSAMQLTYAGEKKALEMLKSYLEGETCQL
ncbi:hypothetical protein LCGC14_0530940 [marine sediment metagenome]|uniref:Uncharacterized protein n=1 Tax=marine sediment metagenome TaxID=412755 RepID=A0A0F9UH43_9ZZZZ|nr:MAG: hypothetical protein Lokiarch_35600 [Candidatus Lokiarchaeum sp. GC14_75]